MALFHCQKAEGQYSESEIYNINNRLKKGDKEALAAIAPYFDSQKILSERLGYHYLETTESSLAKRALDENFIFPDAGLNIDDINNSKDYLNFYNSNKNKIKYSAELKSFYIIPINEKIESVEFRELPKAKLENLKKANSESTIQNSALNNNFELLIKQYNPECLLKICQQLYSERDRFNFYNGNKGYYYDLLKILIQTDIGSGGRDKQLAWDAHDFNFDNNAILNLLIYFSKNYKKFLWNKKAKHFINPNLQVKSIDDISNLFENLYSENDTIAFNSFVKLSESDPFRIHEITKEKENNFMDDTNSIVPIFPYRFLKQLSILTNYCRENDIDYKGNSEIKASIERLSSDLSFKERRKLEDLMISQLSLEDLTPLEYWTIINEKKPELSQSVSRILDIYYSNNWYKILLNEKQLKLYLKKSLLFGNVGINGNVNYYLIKFTGNGSDIITVLNNLKTNDTDIKLQIEKAKKICLEKFNFPVDDKKFNDGNFNSERLDIQKEIDKIRFKQNEQDNFEDAVLHLLAKVNYAQIPEAIKIIDQLKFEEKNYNDKYSFLERDFGFFLIENFKSKEVRDQFLSIYNTHTEQQLYEYYFDMAGVDYKNNEGKLDYHKIYEILKYNHSKLFVGGNQYNNEVAAMIKVLELELKTRLGYPDKLCNSAGMYICPPSERAWEWRKYLEESKLLKQNHSPNVSFNYGYYIDKVVNLKRATNQ